MRYPLFALLFSIPVMVPAQCIADAGVDTVLCNAFMGPEPLQLGGAPAAIGGVEPYTYAWSTHHTYVLGGTVHHITASDILDDTTAAAPFLLHPWDDLYYTLTVTDATGAQCVDSVLVHLSLTGVHLGTYTFHIAPGDSVQLMEPNVFAEAAPLSIQWYPASDLDDPSAVQPWASPEVSTSYGAVVTDAYGCSLDGGTFIQVVVLPVGLQEHRSEGGVRILPLPVRDEAVVQVPEVFVGGTFCVVGADGRLLRTDPIRSTTSMFDRRGLPTGYYVWQAMSPQGTHARGRLVLE